MKTNVKLAAEPTDNTVAELMTDGCNMGIKSLSRYLNQYEAADEKSKNIAKKLVQLEADLVSDMRGYGYDGMLYSSKFYLQSFWLNPQKYHPVWLAHYTSQTDYEGSYAIWQRCAVGRIDGIAGDVDFDVFYKNRGLPF